MTYGADEGLDCSLKLRAGVHRSGNVLLLGHCNSIRKKLVLSRQTLKGHGGESTFEMLGKKQLLCRHNVVTW